MAASVERSATALRAFRSIVKELKKADKNFNSSSPQYAYLMDQMKQHQVTQRIFSKAPHEMEHVAHLYASYLSSTRRLSQLHEQYKSCEKTVEESANLVGLTLPKRY